MSEPALRISVTRMKIEQCTPQARAAWLRQRPLLWPELNDEDNTRDAARLMADPDRYAVFVATDEANKVLAFAEVSIRSDFVNGCETSPAGFLEGIYVAPEERLRGIARALCARGEEWARERGCQEFASDTLVDNTESHAMHRALGFVETERVVYFRKKLS